MLRWFKGKEPPKRPASVTFRFANDPPACHPEAGVQDGETLDALHAEFVRDFCHRPGESFVASLRRDGCTRLIDWLDPKRGEAEAMAFVTLAVDATRKGVSFPEGGSIGGFRHGGAPGRATQDALSVLAQTCGLPIRVYYEKEGETRLLDFAS